MFLDTRILRFAVSTALVVAWLVLEGRACVESEVPPKEVPTSFTVVVRDRGKALPNMSVVVTGEPKIETRMTDSNGYARFENLPDGYYNVHLEAIGGSDERIHVDSSIHDPKYAIWLKWPSAQVITSGLAAGVIRGPCLSIAEDCSLTTELTLIEGRTSREIKSLHVTGRFDFGGVPNGVYFLRVRPVEQDKFYSKPQGDIAVEIDRDAPDQALDIDVVMTDCGMYYSGNCQATEITAYGLCGSVDDGFSGPIPGTELQLQERNSGRVIANAISYAHGRFEMSKDVAAGEYMLTAFAPHFNRLQVPLKLAGGGSCRVPTVIELGALGQCGRAKAGGTGN